MFDKIKRTLLPPALAWRIDRKRRESEELKRFHELYGHFLNSGDLCFDIGANLGNRVRCFSQLGCKVVALEPQTACFKSLLNQFGSHQNVTLVHRAVGRKPGEITMHLSTDHVLSSFSEEFIRLTKESGRFVKSKWDRQETCKMVTLDELIQIHGLPEFIKIDVEGYEEEVLAGLSRAVSSLSIEWVPEMPEIAHNCIEHLESLGAYEYNISWAETMKFSVKGWRSRESIHDLIDQFAGETFLFGDIYARLKSAP